MQTPSLPQSVTLMRLEVAIKRTYQQLTTSSRIESRSRTQDHIQSIPWTSTVASDIHFLMWIHPYKASYTRIAKHSRPNSTESRKIPVKRMLSIITRNISKARSNQRQWQILIIMSFLVKSKLVPQVRLLRWSGILLKWNHGSMTVRRKTHAQMNQDGLVAILVALQRLKLISMQNH